MLYKKIKCEYKKSYYDDYSSIIDFMHIDQLSSEIRFNLQSRHTYSEAYQYCVNDMPCVSMLNYQYASIFAVFKDTSGEELQILRGSSFPDCIDVVNRRCYSKNEQNSFIVPWVWHNRFAFYYSRIGNMDATSMINDFGFDPRKGRYSNHRPDEMLVVPIHNIRPGQAGRRSVGGVIVLANIGKTAHDTETISSHINIVQSIADNVIGPKLYDLAHLEFSYTARDKMKYLTIGHFQHLTKQNKSIRDAMGECISPFFENYGFSRSKKLVYICFLDNQTKSHYRPVAIAGELKDEFEREIAMQYKDSYFDLENSLVKYTLDHYYHNSSNSNNGKPTTNILASKSAVTINDLVKAKDKGWYRDVLGSQVVCSISCPILEYQDKENSEPIAVLVVLSDSYDLMPTQYIGVVESLAVLASNMIFSAAHAFTTGKMGWLLHDMPKLENVDSYVHNADVFLNEMRNAGTCIRTSFDLKQYCNDILVLYPSIVTSHHLLYKLSPIDVSTPFIRLTGWKSVKRCIDTVVRYASLSYAQIDYSKCVETMARINIINDRRVKVHMRLFVSCALNVIKNAITAQCKWNLKRTVADRINIGTEVDDHSFAFYVENNATIHDFEVVKSSLNPFLLMMQDDTKHTGKYGLLIARQVARMYCMSGKLGSLAVTYNRVSSMLRLTLQLPISGD